MSELDLADAILRHALELQRLSANEEAEALRILALLEEELRQLLASEDLSEAGRAELAKLIREADEAIAMRYGEIARSADIQGIALHVAERTADILKASFPDALLPTPERIDSLAKDVLIDGSPVSAWWERQAEDRQFKFAGIVRKGVIEGATTEQIVSRVIGRGDEPGIMDAARRNVRTLVHSSIMTAANQARLETFRKNARFADGVRWLSTLDGRTCLTCMALDGEAWDFDGKPLGATTMDFQMPPAHPACRCVATPVPKSLDKLLGTTGLDAMAAPTVRASANGPTQAVTMEAFLARQSPEFIEEMLGRKRYELWRARKITIRDLVSGSGRPLTLKQLQAR